MSRIHCIRRIRRLIAVLAGLSSALLALAVAAPAAFALPQPPPGGSGGSGAQARVPVITGSGMPGWQIALIAVGAALVAAVAAVLLDRAWLARRHITAAASRPAAAAAGPGAR